MKLLPWRHHVEPSSSNMREAISAIDEANSRAQRTKNILEAEAVVTEKFTKQRQTNGFAEMIAAVISQKGN